MRQVQVETNHSSGHLDLKILHFFLYPRANYLNQLTFFLPIRVHLLNFICCSLCTHLNTTQLSWPYVVFPQPLSPTAILPTPWDTLVHTLLACGSLPVCSGEIPSSFASLSIPLPNLLLQGSVLSSPWTSLDSRFLPVMYSGQDL